MKIKSLLLGSAAAMMTVSTAQAADIIIPEPEVVEYVRVCEAAGTGFFYIPGTETCLKIGGYVRYQIDMENRYTSSRYNTWFTRINGLPGQTEAANDDLTVGPVSVWLGGPTSGSRAGWTKNTRGQLTFETWSDTELGPLRSFIALQGNSNPDVTRTVVLDAAWIDLAGLRMGVNDNAFDGGLLGEADVLGGAKVNFISYTFANGLFSATLSLDDDNAGDRAIFAPVPPATVPLAAGNLPDFLPNISANAMYDFGIGNAALFAAYDNGTDEFAVKGRVGLDVGDDGRLELAAYYTSGATYVFSGSADNWGVVAGAFGAPAGTWANNVPLWSQWSFQAAYQHQVTDALAITGNAGYWDNVGHLEGNAAVPAGFNNLNLWNVGATLDYNVTEGFDIKASVTHWMPTADLDNVLTSKTTGFLRFERSF